MMVPEHVLEGIDDAYHGRFASQQDVREALGDD